MDQLITTIIKRDGRATPFSVGKIELAIVKANNETHEFDFKEARRLSEIVRDILEKVVGVRKEPVTVEQVQDTVEQVLMAGGHFKTAKAYILYRAEHAKIRKVETALGVKNDLRLSINQLKVIERRYLVHDLNGKATETPGQMFRRVARTLGGVEKTASKKKKWAEVFYEIMTKFEFLPGGRTLNNAGTPQNQLANCFVLPIEDTMEGIFDAVKWTALVHQKGGGCIAEGSKVYTSFCGLENFEVLYERLGGKQVEKKSEENGWHINLSDKRIRTLALDEKTGAFVQDRVLDIWRYKLSAERIYTIEAQGGLKITTSDWHPFFVYKNDKIIERRADEIHPHDLLVSGNPSILEQWLFPEYQHVQNEVIDEELGWLVGYILGDGSFGRAPRTSVKQKIRGTRLRLFDGEKDTLTKAACIFSKFTGDHHAIYKDPRSCAHVLTTVNKKVVQFFQKLTEIDGPKSSTLHIPALLIKSPISVVCSVLAGLLDSDGHVAKMRQRVDFSTESPVLAEQISSLFSLLGLQAAVRSKKPTKDHWHLMYEVKLDGTQQLQALNQLLNPYMASEHKKSRLASHVLKMKQLSSDASPLSFELLQPYLEKAGVQTHKTEIHKKAVKVGTHHFWLHRFKWGNGMSIAQMLDLLTVLISLDIFTVKERAALERWRRIHFSLRPVTGIKRPKQGGNFYDFTTECHNNYLAGKNGLTVVHNTGFNFTPLRPRGDSITKSSGGFATGPTSFMKVFDIATRQVMQGGKQRGANMGILAVSHPDILEFINCKTEEGEISNFNISVGATDAFMKAVEQDREFILVNPRTSKAVRSISARLLMDQIVSLAWRTGDPGMIYWDAINRNNPLLDSVGPIYATNPCITGDALIRTNNGQLSVEELIFKLQTGEKILAMTHTGDFERITGWSQNGKKKVYKIVVDGSQIKATADHKFYSKGKFIELSLLKVGDTIVFRQTQDVDFTNVEIQSIEEVGEEEVYDLQVEREHSFIANGFVVHNCGEQPLHPFDSCNLGSINLAAFVRERVDNSINQKDKTKKPELDWNRLGFVTRTAVRLLDNVIDACKYPLPQITKTVQENRRIGLGVMGWADLLLHVGIPYNSDEGVKLAEKVMKFVQEQSWISSEQLAKEKGAFPKWKESWFEKGYDPTTHKYSHKNNPRKLRNVAITTIAPTGTISMAAECSSGIEPVFALSYNKNVVDSAGLTYVNAYFEKALRKEAGSNGKFNEIIAKVAETGSVHNLDDISTEVKKIFVTAHDVSWEWHVKMQAAFQKYTDNAVSKTINFPSTATVEEVREAYMMAWKLGCKGITVYRDKSKGTQVLSLSNGTHDGDKKDSKTKQLMQSQIRIIPLADRTDFASIVRQEIQKGDTIDIPQEEEEKCPECETTMTNQEGCNLCPSCGYSKCKL